MPRYNSVIDSSDHYSRERQHLWCNMSPQVIERGNDPYYKRNKDAFNWIVYKSSRLLRIYCIDFTVRRRIRAQEI